MLIPPVNAVRLTLSGARPAGVPPARVSVSIDGALVLENLEISDEPMEVVVELPVVEGRVRGAAPRSTETAPRELALSSSVFNPAQAGLSADGRQLGVRLYRVELVGEQTRAGER